LQASSTALQAGSHTISKLIPNALQLLQIGAFYEAVGLDALLLVEYCGLNFMGTNREVPRAGCPDSNLSQLLDDLVGKVGVSVVSGCRNMYLLQTGLAMCQPV
jgi:DNA mismatch repair ATPase MutS